MNSNAFVPECVYLEDLGRRRQFTNCLRNNVHVDKVLYIHTQLERRIKQTFSSNLHLCEGRIFYTKTNL